MKFENLKMIWFAGELLPKWAQVLDIASRMCPVPTETRRWFSMFTNGPGTDDGATVLNHCHILKNELTHRKLAVVADLQREEGDRQAARVYEGWIYALETMIQQASIAKTCSWTLEGTQPSNEGGFDDGGITLRRP